MHRVVIAVALAGACSSTPAMEQGMADAPPGHADAATADAPDCVPLQSCSWLDSYQRHIVGALAGAEDVTPGVRLLHRASISERNTARQFLIDELTALGYTPTRQDYTLTSYTGSNVIAELPATTGTGRQIVVGAHFDGVADGPAAADNATGCAIVLAAARYLRTVPVREHPIVFVLFDQEELGLIGSEAYARTLTAASVASVHVFDMVSFDGDGDHAVELWSPVPAVAAGYQQAGAAAGMPVSSVAFASSDHQSFLDHGLPTTGVSEEFVGGDHTPNYHKATDTVANIAFDYLERVTQLAFAVLEADARAP
ncbi:MAG TPA: M28 family peptidase [Kofleriaceae bacterium]